MPPKSRLDEKTVLKALTKTDNNISKAARVLKVPRSTLQNRINSIKLQNETAEDKIWEGGKEGVKIIEKDENTVDLIARFKKRVPAEQIAKEAGYDMKKWKISRVELNQWEVAGKLNLGQDKDKRWQGEKLWKSPLFQIKFKLERRSPKLIQDALELLQSDWSKPAKAPKIKRIKQLDDPHMLEISLFDVHFGKIAWADESGERYDLNIAKKIYNTAIEDLLERSLPFNIERIVYPVGQDFFNVDDWKGQTTKGTLVESTEDRFPTVFTAGYESIKDSLLRCREIAPVHVLWSPGNHDRSTSWYLCKTLKSYFEGAGITDITFDLGFNQRKYELYGNTLLGFTHSCDEKMSDLPLIMAKEAKNEWSLAQYHQWHVGHFHKKKQMKFIAGDTFNGVGVTILPSLTATDSYHYRNGWVKPTRAAEAYLWSKDRGLSNFMVHTVN